MEESTFSLGYNNGLPHGLDPYDPYPYLMHMKLRELRRH